MITFNLSKSRRACVWINELPNLSYPSNRTLRTSVHSLPQSTERKVCVAVELLIPTGPRFHYGAIGVELTPNNTSTLIIEVAASESVDSIIESALAKNLDTVRVGLSIDYARSALEGFTYSNSLSPLGAGLAQINHAAHGEVGSSMNFFQYLARILHQLTSQYLKDGATFVPDHFEELLNASTLS